MDALRLTHDSWSRLCIGTLCKNGEFPKAIFRVGRTSRGDRRLFFHSGYTESPWAKRADGWNPTPSLTWIAHEARVMLPEGI